MEPGAIILDFRNLDMCAGPCDSMSPVSKCCDDVQRECKWSRWYPGIKTQIKTRNGYMCQNCQQQYDDLWDQFKWARAVSADMRMQELRMVFEQDALSVRHKFEQGNQVISDEAEK